MDLRGFQTLARLCNGMRGSTLDAHRFPEQPPTLSVRAWGSFVVRESPRALGVTAWVWPGSYSFLNPTHFQPLEVLQGDQRAKVNRAEPLEGRGALGNHSQNYPLFQPDSI